MYSNMDLLNKYNRTIPETWDDFLDTASYILKEERKLNNTKLVAYSGCFDGNIKILNKIKYLFIIYISYFKVN